MIGEVRESVGNTRRVDRISERPLAVPELTIMKPQVEEVEDDLAAEEENKLINEVIKNTAVEKANH
jgi:hypothetical protein